MNSLRTQSHYTLGRNQALSYFKAYVWNVYVGEKSRDPQLDASSWTKADE